MASEIFPLFWAGLFVSLYVGKVQTMKFIEHDNHEAWSNIQSRRFLCEAKGIFFYWHINTQSVASKTYSYTYSPFFIRLLLVTTFIGQIDFWPRFVRRQVHKCVSSEHEHWASRHSAHEWTKNWMLALSVWVCSVVCSVLWNIVQKVKHMNWKLCISAQLFRILCKCLRRLFFSSSPLQWIQCL